MKGSLAVRARGYLADSPDDAAQLPEALLPQRHSGSEATQAVLSQVKQTVIRPMYSSPPLHGARLATMLLTDAELQLGADEWANMRDPWEEARLRQPFSFVPRPTSPSKVAAQPNDEYGECAPCK